MTILNIEKLFKNYGKKEALHDVSLIVERGSICGLLGLNGAGKSTLMKIVCNLSNLTSGTVKIMGKNISDIEYCNNITGCMIESPAFYPNLTGKQNLQAFSYLYKDNFSYNYLNELLTSVGLGNQRDIPIRKYSLGMKQRLHFALALLNRPKLLILDEPFNGIDPIAVKNMRELILKESEKGTAILISSHCIPEMQNICNQVYILDKGKVVYNDKCRKETTLEKIFLSFVSEGGQAQ